MHKIDNKKVELNLIEQRASDYFDILLNQGWGINAAVSKIKTTYVGLEPEFYDYLAN